MSRRGLSARKNNYDPTQLFEPDVLLPAQYGAAVRDQIAVPERLLMLAVLDEAMRHYMKTLLPRAPRVEMEHRAVAAWFASRDATWLYAFENICDHMGLDAEWIRGGLQRWAMRVRAGTALLPMTAREKGIVARGERLTRDETDAILDTFARVGWGSTAIASGLAALGMQIHPKSICEWRRAHIPDSRWTTPLRELAAKALATTVAEASA